MGPDVAQFEKDFAKYCGAEHCVAFNSGTSALHVAMLLLNVEARAMKWSRHRLHLWPQAGRFPYVGAKPVFVDTDDTTFNLDPHKVEKAITPRTKAVMPVHLYGQPL